MCHSSSYLTMEGMPTKTRKRKPKKTPFLVKEKCDWCDKEFDFDKMSSHKCDKIFYLCCLESDCDSRVWRYPHELKKHMDICHLKQKIKCLKCNKLFTRSDNMKKHLNISCKINKNSAKRKEQKQQKQQQK